MRNRPSDRDVIGAFAALLSIALCVVGFAVALAGIYDLTHGGGPAAPVVTLVGVAFILAGIALAVLGAGGGRG